MADSIGTLKARQRAAGVEDLDGITEEEELLVLVRSLDETLQNRRPCQWSRLKGRSRVSTRAVALRVISAELVT